jgi:ribokinase
MKSFLNKIQIDKNIVVLGALNMDLNIHTNRVPEVGETFEGDSFYTNPGGKAGNQAVSAIKSSKLDKKVYLISSIGDDIFGKDLISYLSDQRINVENIEVKKSVSSGIAIITLLPDGQNSVNAVYGANTTFNKKQINSIKKLSKTSSILLTQQEIPLDVTFQGLKIAKDNNMITILDPSPNKIIPEKFYDYVDIITPNEIEAEYLSGISITSLEEAKQSAEYISSLGPKNVIITLADKGSWVQSEDFVGHIKSYEVNVLASVAAGDAFNGALASSLSTGSSLFSSVKFASAAAALSVSRKGAQESMPYLHEIQELMN